MTENPSIIENLNKEELKEIAKQYQVGDAVDFPEHPQFGIIDEINFKQGIPIFRIRMQNGKIRIAGPKQFRKYNPEVGNF